VRPPFSGLATERLRAANGYSFDGRAPIEIVLGRRFCIGCGRWRHLCDFGHMQREGRGSAMRSRCRACSRIQARRYRERRTARQRELQREYQRIWQEVQRRRRGIAPRRYENRRTVIDRPEYVFLPVEPIRALLAERFGEWRTIAAATGLTERALHRLLHEHRHVRLDVADRIAGALGEPLGLLYLGIEPEGRDGKTKAKEEPCRTR
jgi:hypothetical protein